CLKIMLCYCVIDVESLTCNKCSFGLFGLCMNSGADTCSTNTSVCYTGKATFPSVQTFPGFTIQGCREPLGCNMTTNGTLLSISYEIAIECCSADFCNPIHLSGATANKMTLAAAVGAAALASLWGNAL
uniref:UPAR/Ly6 domain-containing protein n=1 Tax=Salarias fasciatus TaxID=181472 RepID=A0A672INL4_SALFA